MRRDSIGWMRDERRQWSLDGRCKEIVEVG
jgi:hypothetical protein